MVATRRATTEDVDVIAAIAMSAFEHYTERIGAPPIPMGVDYAQHVANDHVWVAEEDGRVVGFAVLVEQDDHLLLDVLAVGPDAQGRGIGTLLLRLTDDEARRLGHTEVRLFTNAPMTENIAYYPRHGYVETHRSEQDGRHRVFFAKTLQQ
jgi:GNAT superfamily N-acetyltransferase